MSARQKQVKQPKNTQPSSEPSPWTEPFQRAEEAAAAQKPETADQAQTTPKREDRQDEPTHNALSTIFNGR
jgi:hypothetical protein